MLFLIIYKRRKVRLMEPHFLVREEINGLL